MRHSPGSVLASPSLMLFHPSSTGTAGPSHQSPLAPLRRPRPEAGNRSHTVINLGLLSSDAHGNSFTAGAGKSLSPASFDAPSRQCSVRRVCESVRELLLAGQQGLFLSRRFHATARAVAVSPESYIESGYEQHCLGTPNSRRSYARRADASRSCARSWMSPSVGSILGEQGQQPTDQCRLYVSLTMTGIADGAGR